MANLREGDIGTPEKFTSDPRILPGIGGGGNDESPPGDSGVMSERESDPQNQAASKLLVGLAYGETKEVYSEDDYDDDFRLYTARFGMRYGRRAFDLKQVLTDSEIHKRVTQSYYADDDVLSPVLLLEKLVDARTPIIKEEKREARQVRELDVLSEMAGEMGVEVEELNGVSPESIIGAVLNGTLGVYGPPQDPSH